MADTPNTELPRPADERPSEIKVGTVTPELAQHWLDHNNKMNRKLSPTETARYAADIRAGRWNDTTDPIKFDVDGQIADGQHRLGGIIEAGTAVECHISYGLPLDRRINIDDGRKRSFADDLHMNGRPRSTETEGLLRKILIWRDIQGLPITGGPRRVSRAALAEQYANGKHAHGQGYAAEIREALEIADAHRKLPCSRPTGQFMAWLLRQYAPESLVHKFFTILSIGSLDPGDAVLVRLREKLEQNRLEARLKISRSYTAYEVWWMIRGWNAWLNRENLRSYNVPKGGLRPPFDLPVQVAEAAHTAAVALED